MQPHRNLSQLHPYVVVINAVDAVSSDLTAEQHGPVQRILISGVIQCFLRRLL